MENACPDLKLHAAPINSESSHSQSKILPRGIFLMGYNPIKMWWWGSYLNYASSYWIVIMSDIDSYF